MHMFSLSLSLSLVPPSPVSSAAEPTEEQPPDVATPQQQQVVIQPAEPQGDLMGGNLLDLLDISTGPTAAAPTYTAPTGGGGMLRVV